MLCCVASLVALLLLKSSSSAMSVIVTEPSVSDPKDIVPVVVMLDEPLSIAPNPELILPLFNAQ